MRAAKRSVYGDNHGLQGGTVLRKVAAVLTDTFCSGGVAETTPTAENIFHITYGDPVCATQKDFQDYGDAVADPDGTDFWMAHAYAMPSGFKVVGGKVVP